MSASIKMKNSRFTLTKIIRGVWYRTRIWGEGFLSIPIKLWYGNSAGFSNNFGAKRHLQRLQQDFISQYKPIPVVQADSFAAESLRSHGYLILPAHYGRTFLLNIQKHVAELIEDPATSMTSPNGATRFLLDPTEKIPELRMLLRDEICRIIASYYGCALRVESVRVWRNYHVSNIDGDRDDKFSNTFHHDNCPANGLRVFVLLTDGVTRETGAFRFHDKNASKKIIRQLGYFHRVKLTSSMRQRLVNPSTLKFFEGDLGDVCICNTQECLHAASVPRAGSYRDILQFEVYPASGELRMADKLLETVPPDKALQMMRG
ncbi:Uncharacterised protein [Legionella lansingensis]|uniref:Phytanoyl-CoA dioxygenase (PhyH) n=1 Tax=Legionella lansingensis TaxID=45067 RepID=A0A0W0VWE5_9GAMM|nr:hypothetical protein [Legionella lansingensis]KTD24321.1 hypothetical protein Llan_0460 [Legionella lansingensis]SNV51804.1 Uncharacterised protein [Legionella lansingensis]